MAVSFLMLVNGIAEKITDGNATEIMDGDELFSDRGIDSLAVIMICHYVVEFYGLPPGLEKSLMPKTTNDLYQVVWNQKTKEPDSLMECLDIVQ